MAVITCCSDDPTRAHTVEYTWNNYDLMQNPAITQWFHRFCMRITTFSTAANWKQLQTLSLPSSFLSLLLLPVHPPAQLDLPLSSETGQFLQKTTHTYAPCMSCWVCVCVWLGRLLGADKTVQCLLSTNSLHSSLSSEVLWLTSGSRTRSLFSSSK